MRAICCPLASVSTATQRRRCTPPYRRSARGKAPFPFVAGNEGVGQVEAVGSGVKGLAAGDFVVASTPGMGASHALPRTAGRRRRCVAAAPRCSFLPPLPLPPAPAGTWSSHVVSDASGWTSLAGGAVPGSAALSVEAAAVRAASHARESLLSLFFPDAAPCRHVRSARRTARPSAPPLSPSLSPRHPQTSVAAPLLAKHLLATRPLARGAVLVQNCAGSTVGQAVIQYAAAAGVKTVNIMRKTSDWENKVTYLQGLGAGAWRGAARRGAALAAALAARRAARERDSRSAAAFPRLTALSRSTHPPPPPAPRARPPPGLVVDEDFARRAPAFARLLSDVAPPALGLNGTGGAAAAAVLRALAPGADLVTYGCMSGQPVRAGADVFATKQQTLRGASLAAALAGLAKPARDAAVRAAVDDVAGGEAARVRLLLAREPFADFPAALARAARAGERKVVLVMA